MGRPTNSSKRTGSLRERVGLGLLLSLRHDLNCASAGLSVGGPEHRGGSSKMSSVDRNVLYGLKCEMFRVTG